MSQKRKIEKTSNIAQNLTPFFDWPLYIFTFQKWKGQFWKKSFFGELEDLKIFRSEKVNREISAKSPRNFIEISSRFHRDFACCKSKKKKKGKLFYLSKAIFWKTSLNFDRVYLRSSSRSELQILQAYSIPYPLIVRQIFFRSEKIFFLICIDFRPCLSACFLASSALLTFQIWYTYVIYLHTPMHKIIFRCENFFFCFCFKIESNFHRFLLASFPLLCNPVLPVYVIYLHTPLPKIIFRSENFFFCFCPKIESNFHRFLLVYFPSLTIFLLPPYVTHYLL